jgi:hypothetical protein
MEADKPLINNAPASLLQNGADKGPRGITTSE